MNDPFIKQQVQRSFLLLIVGLWLMCLPVIGQQPGKPVSRQRPADTTAAIADTMRAIVDTLQPDPVKPFRKVVEEAGRANLAKFRTDQLTIKQDDLIEKIKKNIYTTKLYLKEGIDTGGINAELEDIGRWYAIAGDGVFVNKGNTQTHRNLATSAKVLHELLSRVRVRKAQADKYQTDLMDIRHAIDSLTGDSILYKFTGDSIQMVQYLQKLISVAHEMRPADSILRQALPHVRALQIRLNELVTMLGARLEEIDVYQSGLSHGSFTQELPRLWQQPSVTRPFGEIIRFSIAKDRLSLQFYIANNPGNIVLLLLLVVVVTIFLRSLKRKVIKSNLLDADYTGQHVLRYPLLSAIVMVFNLFQFVFPEPPFVFSCLLWMGAGISLTFIFRHFISSYWMKIWLLLLGMFVVACAINLVLQASRTERWLMFCLSVSACCLVMVVIFNGHRQQLKERSLLFFVAFMGLLEMTAAIANLAGWYNFSKTSLVSGFCCIVMAVLLLWTLRLINEGLALASEVYRGPQRQSFYVNFEKVGKKAPPVFFLLLVAGWFILFGRNFYVFRLLTDPVEEFLFRTRRVGDYSFSIQGMLAFFVILAIAVIVSKVVSFFASGSYSSQGGQDTGKGGIGSWLLLVRIAIISIGLFLAFAAAGIPMDKVTLILGALGVGIGFGLQTLVNNLVSGLIIAFEKPVNVGDIVEVAGKGGAIKSIGFRSSILAAWDGASVVIPNGDLLNQHVVNWTQGNTLRRGDITVGVAYGTDLVKVKELLTGILSRHEKILKFPPPAVLTTAFGSNSIDFQVFFWLGHTRDLGMAKSEVINAIHLAFKENGIEIPFPQQDLHIRSLPEKEG